MRRTLWLRTLVGPAVVAAALAACDRPAAKTARNSAPGDGDLPASVDAQPAGSTQPQTAPETQPANAFLTVDGKVVEFPPARLRLTPTDEGVTALLFSDDPPSATAASYTGNGFYFDLALRVADPERIDGAEYYYKADDSEPSESLNGILLHGTRYHLQPQDVVIKFEAQGRKVMASIAGRFLVVRTSSDGKEEAAPARMAAVQGTLYTTAEIKEHK